MSRWQILQNQEVGAGHERKFNIYGNNKPRSENINQTMVAIEIYSTKFLMSSLLYLEWF